MSETTKNKIFQGLVALLFTLMLFFNAKSTSTVGKLFPERINYEEMLQNVPVTVLYDSDEYFIHGFDNAVSVRLNSANRIQLNTETDANTRKFQVVADVRNLKPGTHEVKLNIDNLSSAVDASVEPDHVTMTIEKIAKKTFTVHPVLSDNTNQNGLKVGALSVNPEEVEITTGEETLKQIDRIVASVDSSQLNQENTSVQAKVQALTSSGESLPIKSNPEMVTVSADFDTPSKAITLYGVQNGTLPDGVINYQFKLEPTTATVSGDWSIIGDINNLAVPIDITGVTETTERKLDISVSDNYTVTPAKVNVTIVPVKQNETSDTSGSSKSETASSAKKVEAGNDSASPSSAPQSSAGDSATAEPPKPSEGPEASKETIDTAVNPGANQETARN